MGKEHLFNVFFHWKWPARNRILNPSLANETGMPKTGMVKRVGGFNYMLMKKVCLIGFCTMIGLSVFAQRGFQSEDLRSDPLFMELVNQSAGLTKKILESCRKKDISVDQLQEEAQKLQNERNASPDDMLRKMDELIGGELKYSFSDFYNRLVVNWASIKDKYGERLTNEYIKTEAEAAAKSIYSIDDGTGWGCRDLPGYVKCAASATATAILSHAGCVATIIGVPLCVALVGIIQIAAINECSRTYCSDK